MKRELVPAVKGKVIDENTRCIHYHSPLDVIAIKFRCCNEYYSCYECHGEEAGHKSEVWGKSEFGTKAILCGVCYNELTIHEYLASNNRCPHCNSTFNANCNKHYHFYFEI
jgi:uncharacterized CHY-type Zn-finger protein